MVRSRPATLVWRAMARDRLRSASYRERASRPGGVGGSTSVGPPANTTTDDARPSHRNLTHRLRSECVLEPAQADRRLSGQGGPLRSGGSSCLFRYIVTSSSESRWL